MKRLSWTGAKIGPEAGDPQDGSGSCRDGTGGASTRGQRSRGLSAGPSISPAPPGRSRFALGLASGVSIGQDAGAPVTDEYRPPFPFTGTLRRVVYDVSGKQVVDHEAEIRIALARQ